MVQLQSEEAHWIQHGHLDVPAWQQVEVEQGGQFSFGPSSTLHAGENGGIKFFQSESAIMTLDQNVQWIGNGQVGVYGGRCDWLEEGQLYSAVNHKWLGTKLHGNSSETWQLFTTNRVIFEDGEIAELAWEHHGNQDIDNSFRLGHSELSEAKLKIVESPGKLKSNEMVHSQIDLDGVASPFFVLDNNWHSAWYNPSPSLTISSNSESIRLEGNNWIGGVGLSLIDANVVATCNVWDHCEKGVVLIGETESCFAMSCGGGHNQWKDNTVHFELQDTPLPVLEWGNNMIATADEWVFEGSTSSNTQQWNIAGVDWADDWTTGPTTALIPSMLESCNGNNCEPINCWKEGQYAFAGCPLGGKPKPSPSPKSLHFLGSWNFLGQEVLSVQ